MRNSMVLKQKIKFPACKFTVCFVNFLVIVCTVPKKLKQIQYLYHMI